MARHTESGLPFEPVYGPSALDGWDPATALGEPGAYPFTRGVYGSMYRGKLFTMRQFAGFGTVEETNERFRYLIEHGQTGLSTAFDMPTLMGYDPDHERSLGEVWRVRIATVGDALPGECEAVAYAFAVLSGSHVALTKLHDAELRSPSLRSFSARGAFR